MKKKYKLKFLSESILLEETGLPFVNTAIVLSVALFIGLFILWSNQVSIEESVDISGNIAGNKVSQITGYATTNNITSIAENAKVYIDIPGVTGRQSLGGYVESIDKEPVYDSQNNPYYAVHIKFITDSASKELLEGMEARLEIVTGSRTLLQYFLGSLYETGASVID